MKTKLIVAAIVAVSTFAGLNTANAQQSRQYQQTQQYQQQQQQQQFIATPKLGVQVIESHGIVEVTSVFWNTPAKRMGLEAGDRILKINGHNVSSIHDMQRWLIDAVDHHHGQVRLLVDNVRARHGQHHVERYVSVATYLDGYGGGHHDHDSTPVYSQQR